MLVRRLMLVAAVVTAVVAQTALATAAPSRDAWDPSLPPARLTDFAANINKSMVTVYCGNSLGSGWTSTVTIGKDDIAAGYRTYVITNHHVIERCTYSNTRYIEVRQGGIKYPAYVWSWDEENDLAGLLTTADLPKLQWSQVPRPLPGQWVAAFGSPYGLAGSITTGIVSYVGDAELTSTAPINPGNSGGPLVDNKGRVLGINTASIDGSNGFGIVMGTPLLCNQVVSCGDADAIWVDEEPRFVYLTAQRVGASARFLISAEGLEGETVTLFVRRPGETEYKRHPATQVVSNAGEAEFVLNDPSKLFAYVEVANAVSNRVILAESKTPPGKLNGIRATPLGGGQVRLSWNVPAWAGPESPASYQFRVNGGAWKATKKSSVVVSGLKVGKSVRLDVRAVRGGPGSRGQLGAIVSVSVRPT